MRGNAPRAVPLSDTFTPAGEVRIVSTDETRWSEIANLYEMLERGGPSPINTLNRAIAIAEWQGPDAGLALLEAINPPNWLLGYYLWDATLGELYRRRGDRERATAHLTRALDAAPTHAEKALIRRRLDKLCDE